MSSSGQPANPHSSIAVPVAVDKAGELVRPQDADPAGSYRCPGCGSELIVRQGELRRAHFAHRRGDGCSIESVLHRAAKRRLVQVVEQWLHSGGPRPCISRPCPLYTCDGGVVQDVPDDVTGVAEEVRLADGTIGDVVLYRDQSPCAVVEVMATHAVGREKAARLGLPWFEVEAEAVLERPYWWVAVQDGLEPFTCPACSRMSGMLTKGRSTVFRDPRGGRPSTHGGRATRSPPSPEPSLSLCRPRVLEVRGGDVGLLVAGGRGP